MPQFVRRALKRNRLMNAYLARPAYQQNDYISWITGAKREETAERRLKQMLAELKQGDSYMNMPYHPDGRRVP
jgi:uncharacterized protein YdeI (YjbR/CyaY-like superfamily)